MVLLFLLVVSTLVRMSHMKETKSGTLGRYCVVQPMNWYCITWCEIPS